MARTGRRKKKLEGHGGDEKNGMEFQEVCCFLIPGCSKKLRAVHLDERRRLERQICGTRVRGFNDTSSRFLREKSRWRQIEGRQTLIRTFENALKLSNPWPWVGNCRPREHPRNLPFRQLVVEG